MIDQRVASILYTDAFASLEPMISYGFCPVRSGYLQQQEPNTVAARLSVGAKFPWYRLRGRKRWCWRCWNARQNIRICLQAGECEVKFTAAEKYTFQRVVTIACIPETFKKERGCCWCKCFGKSERENCWDLGSNIGTTSSVCRNGKDEFYGNNLHPLYVKRHKCNEQMV